MTTVGDNTEEKSYLCKKYYILIRKINIDLYNWYSSLDNKNKYTNPYLIVPEDSYVNSKMKVLVLGKETNGWGEAENCKTCKELEDLYIEKIIGKETSKEWKESISYSIKEIIDTKLHEK